VFEFEFRKGVRAPRGQWAWVNRFQPIEPVDVHSLQRFYLEHDRETARERAEVARNTSDTLGYSDTSGREGHLGAAIVALSDNEEVTECAYSFRRLRVDEPT
jgi:hypothetical protein